MSPHPAARRPGFTLLELVIALAISAVLGAIATPSFNGLVARQRLQGAAHHLRADIAMARAEAGRRGQTVHLVFQPGPGWCYALSTNSVADCRQTRSTNDSSVIKVVRAAEHPGITLVDASPMALDARTGTSVQATGQARFSAAEDQQLRVRLGRLGHASVCAPTTPIAGTPPCPADTPAS